MGFKNKKAMNLREKFIQEQEDKKNKRSGGNTDKRFLNYFDLEEGQKMTIRLLPDGGDSGEYWLEYSTHGSKLKVRGVDSIACAYTSSGEECPACQKFFDLWEEDNKDEAKRWGKKETIIAQCLVVDSPIEVNETEDGNPVKLIYLPFGVRDMIKEQIIEGQIEDPSDFELILKKTKNSGGYAAYDKSYFDMKSEPLSDEIIEMFDSGELELFDLSEELPAATTTEDVDEWMDKVMPLVDKHDRRKGSGSSSSKSTPASHDDNDNGDNDNDGDDTPPKPTKVKASDLVNKLKKKDKQSS